MTFTEQLLSHIDEANKKFGLFSAGERVLVGFSGGADSLALLDALHGLLGENVYAFHVNHMLRGTEADGDELFCRNFCEQRGISFCSKRIDVAALSRELHGGGAIEETARDARYAALAEESRRVGAKKSLLRTRRAITRKPCFSTWRAAQRLRACAVYRPSAHTQMPK